MDEHHILSFLFFIFAWQIEVMVSVPPEKSSKVLEFLSSVLRPGKWWIMENGFGPRKSWFLKVTEFNFMRNASVESLLAVLCKYRVPIGCVTILYRPLMYPRKTSQHCGKVLEFWLTKKYLYTVSPDYENFWYILAYDNARHSFRYWHGRYNFTNHPLFLLTLPFNQWRRNEINVAGARRGPKPEGLSRSPRVLAEGGEALSLKGSAGAPGFLQRERLPPLTISKTS